MCGYHIQTQFSKLSVTTSRDYVTLNVKNLGCELGGENCSFEKLNVSLIFSTWRVTKWDKYRFFLFTTVAPICNTFRSSISFKISGLHIPMSEDLKNWTNFRSGPENIFLKLSPNPFSPLVLRENVPYSFKDLYTWNIFRSRSTKTKTISLPYILSLTGGFAWHVISLNLDLNRCRCQLTQVH